jgi:hypothetical protein
VNGWFERPSPLTSDAREVRRGRIGGGKFDLRATTTAGSRNRDQGRV